MSPGRPTLAARALACLAGAALVLLLALASGTALEREAGACSCSGPRPALVSPDRVDDAALDAKVRVELPSYESPGALVLRAHAGGDVATTRRILAPGGSLTHVELTPAAPLAPSTQYEVALQKPEAHPSVLVLGTFRTGTARDTVPPRLDALGSVVAFANGNAMGGSCQVAGPWVTLEGIRAEDPGHAPDRLVFAVWLADGAGNVDPSRAPTTVLAAHDGKLTIGQVSLCDPNAFPFPKAGAVQLGIAALDESGNASAVRKVRVDLSRARHP